jgi:hypothetical protein
MTLDTSWCEKAIQLLIKARGSSWGNTGSTPHFESGESPVSHESSKIPILHTAIWGIGRGGFIICIPKDLLNKSVNYTHIIIKRSMRMRFYGKHLKQKGFLRHFARHFFLFSKNILLKPFRTYFRFQKRILCPIRSEDKG